MSKNEVIENVLVSPTVKCSYSWSGKTFEINFMEPLEPNTTYCLSLGTDYTDYLKNKPSEAFNLVFSTGSVLDSCSIEGKLFDKNPQGAYVFAFRIDDINPDTLNPAKVKPHYLTQIGTSGAFRLSALKHGKYRLFAIREQLKNFLYNPGSDSYGSATEDVELDSLSKKYIEIKLGPSIDEQKPMLFGAEALNSKAIIASFSESIAPLSVSSRSFVVTDSLGVVVATPSSAFVSYNSPSEIQIRFAESLPAKTILALRCVADSVFTVRDSMNNPIDSTKSVAFFYGSDDPDILKLALTSLPLKDSSRNIGLEPEFRLVFNSDINIDESFTLNNAFELINPANSKSLPLKYKPNGENEIIIQPVTKLETSHWYKLAIHFNGFLSKTARSATDTTLELSFQTADSREFGSVSGIIKDVPFSDNYMLVLSSNDGKKTYSTKLKDSLRWEFIDIPTGSYKAELFEDTDQNGAYNYGCPFPFEYSEKFFRFRKEIVVPSRWKVENIVLKRGE
jgi:hypothetical protein